MKVKEIKQTIEQVVRVEYIAEDGEVFRSEEECKKYEESALFAVSRQLKRLNTRELSKYDLNEDGCEDDKMEIFDIQTEKDLENLRRYLYLTLKKHNSSESSINECFTSKDGVRKDYVFDGITIGHEVIICFSYDQDWFWTYKDGSIEGYLSWIRDRITKLITPKEEPENVTH